MSGTPRRSPSPCSEGCPGWAIFNADEEPEIQRCDECWSGVEDAPWDEAYVGVSECQAALLVAQHALMASFDESLGVHAFLRRGRVVTSSRCGTTERAVDTACLFADIDQQECTVRLKSGSFVKAIPRPRPAKRAVAS